MGRCIVHARTCYLSLAVTSAPWAPIGPVPKATAKFDRLLGWLGRFCSPDLHIYSPEKVVLKPALCEFRGEAGPPVRRGLACQQRHRGLPIHDRGDGQAGELEQCRRDVDVHHWLGECRPRLDPGPCSQQRSAVRVGNSYDPTRPLLHSPFTNRGIRMSVSYCSSSSSSSSVVEGLGSTGDKEEGVAPSANLRGASSRSGCGTAPSGNPAERTRG